MASTDGDSIDTASVAASSKAPGSEPAYSFFYGTLMAPEVFFRVCYGLARVPAELAKLHPFQDAMLYGYTRHRVQGEDYPGIIDDSADGACVRGVLVAGITADNMSRLDRFEGSWYERRDVDVEVIAEVDAKSAEAKSADGTTPKKTVSAKVYVFKHPDYLERREWDYEEFRREKMHKWSRAGFTFEEE